MKVAVLLGNRLHDDGAMSDIQIERLKMAIELKNDLNPDYFILSGGVANPLANRSEASAMYEYLIDHGFSKESLILEDKSMYTVQNAQFSLPIIEKLNPDMVIVCTSDYHIKDPGYHTVSAFMDILKGKNIKFLTYTVVR